MDLTAIEKKDAVLAQQIILLSNFIANIWSKIMKIHENKFKTKYSTLFIQNDFVYIKDEISRDKQMQFY